MCCPHKLGQFILSPFSFLKPTFFRDSCRGGGCCSFSDLYWCYVNQEHSEERLLVACNEKTDLYELRAVYITPTGGGGCGFSSSASHLRFRISVFKIKRFT